MISKVTCLYIYLLLYGGTILALFVRAFVRRRLLEEHRSLFGAPRSNENESLLARVVLAVPRQTAALRTLGKSLEAVPATVNSRYKRFQVLTWIAVALLVLHVVFSFTAHKVCGA